MVRGVCKRRTWLSWVDHDPYDEKSEEPVSPPRKKAKAESSSDEDDNGPLPFGASFKNMKLSPNILFTQLKRLQIIKALMPHQIYNHIDGINQIAAKCQLHRNMKRYALDVTHEDPWGIMPETYIVELPAEKCSAKYVFEHEEFKEFARAHRKNSWWIIKPGEDANRGHGIKVMQGMDRIRQTISSEFLQG